MAEQINAQIVPVWYPGKISLKFKDIRPTQNQLDKQDISQAVGILTIDEVRAEWYGKKPLPGGQGNKIYKGGSEGMGDEAPVVESSRGLPAAPSNPQLFERSIPVRRISSESYIKRVLKSVADQLPGGTIFKYSSYQGLVLKYGIYQKGVGRREHFEGDLWTEGYATLRSMPMPVHHSWWTGYDGEIRDDSDSADEIIEYMGIVFSPEYSKDTTGIFMDDILNGSVLLKNGIEKYMLWDPKQERERVMRQAMLVAAKCDLDKWMRRAVILFMENKEDEGIFVSEFLLPETCKAIKERLSGVETEKEIKEIFKEYQVNVQGKN
jgi:hypothetical protein